MAKRDKKKGEGKLPRKVAGLKGPKKLRNAGKKALKLARQPVVSEVVAAAMLAAAAALRDQPEGKRSAKTAGRAAEAAGKEASRLGESLRMLALDLARRSLDAWEEGQGSGRKAKRGGAAKGSPG